MPFELDVPGVGRVRPGKIVCIGKNYAEHVREMSGTDLGTARAVDHDAVAEDPVVFLKPASSLLHDGGVLRVPAGVGDVHHEVELAVVMKDTPRGVAREDALAHVAGYAVAVDVTARDLQKAAKNAGRPWALSKGLDGFCPLSRVVPVDAVPDPQAVPLRLTVNGDVRQDGSTAAMMRPVADLIAFTSRWMTLEAGDVLLTGTPEGVGPMRPGDAVVATADGVGRVAFTVDAASE